MDLLVLESERLLIRASYIDDAAFYLELMNTPKWKHNIGDRGLKTLEDAVNYISDKMLPQYTRLGFGNFMLIRKSDGAKVGSCGLFDREGLEGFDIGFSIHPNFERKGYAYEASCKIIEEGRMRLGFTKLSGITIPENIASQSLLKKLGLKFTRPIKLPEDPIELYLFERSFS